MGGSLRRSPTHARLKAGMIVGNIPKKNTKEFLKFERRERTNLEVTEGINAT